MEWYQVLLLILIIIAGLIILYAIVDIIFVFTFIRIFKKHNKALQVFLSNKYDNIAKLLSACQAHNLAIKTELLSAFNKIDKRTFINQESSDCHDARLTLSALRDELLFLIEANNLPLDEDVIQIKNNVLELDSNYRTLIAMYNADVLGYNYWINVFPARYVYKLLGWRKKQIINQ